MLPDSSRDQTNKKIQLKDLDWENRERILRLLFSKMNSGVACINWRNLNQDKYDEDIIVNEEGEMKPWSDHHSESNRS